eukprot:GGOE01000235.1.p1 GENE.GGOE01000235.1~~GGOE01000235.1.p1  ORF type:complete len:636 (+),score=134.11 GGOE01000235.1:85-1992(+)
MDGEVLWACPMEDPSLQVNDAPSEAEVLRFDSDGSAQSWSDDYNDCPIPRPEQARAWAMALTMPDPSGLQGEALAALQGMSAGDIVANEFWADIQESLAGALNDPDPSISDGALRLFLRLFHSASAEQTADIFTAVARHVLRDVAAPSEWPAAAVDGDAAFRRLLLKFRALWKMAHDLPAHWLAFRPEQESALLAAMCDLLALRVPSLVCETPGEWRCADHLWLASPLVHFALIDPEALWFQRWCHRAASRRQLVAVLQASGVLRCLLRLSCHDGLPPHPPDLAQLREASGLPNPSQRTGSLSASEAAAELLLLHAVGMTGQCLQYEEGRNAIDASELLVGVQHYLKSLCCDPTPVRLALQALVLQLSGWSFVRRQPAAGSTPLPCAPAAGDPRPQPNPFAPQRTDRLARVVEETLWSLASSPQPTQCQLTLDHLGLLLQPLLALRRLAPTQPPSRGDCSPTPFLSRPVSSIFYVAAALLHHRDGRQLLLRDLPPQWRDGLPQPQHDAATPSASSAIHLLLASAVEVVRHDRCGRRGVRAALAFIRTAARHSILCPALQSASVVPALLCCLQELQPKAAAEERQCSSLRCLLLDSLADFSHTPAGLRLLYLPLVGHSSQSRAYLMLSCPPFAPPM